ncbi:MAG: hypothetical protein GY701_35155, partial [Sulfitobacter sp.]|nr:hypothetical protein [Sulfitobacter sp.]
MSNKVFITEWYPKQGACLQRADELSAAYLNVLCVARDPYQGSPTKQYACVYGGASDREKVDFVRGLGDGHMYELIRAYKPVKAYMDLDFVLDAENWDHQEMVDGVIEAFGKFTHTDVSSAVITRCVRPHNPNKGSFHVLFPHHLFEYAHRSDRVAADNGLKKLMTAFTEWCANYDGELFPDGKFLVDTTVYSKNRLMRLPGNSKNKPGDTPLKFVDQEESNNPDNWFVRPQIIPASERDENMYLDVDKILARWYDENTKFESGPDKYALKVKGAGKFTITPEWTPLITGVTIKTDADMLNHLDAQELKKSDWPGVFLPVVASLSKTVDRETLAYWCSTSKENYLERYGPIIDSAARRPLWISGGAAMRVLAYKAKKGLTDLRENVAMYKNPSCASVEAADDDDDGWEGVPAKDLFGKIVATGQSDNMRKVTAARRCFFISGKMGVSKT